MKHVIILPVRNGAPYIITAIESVLTQTYGDWHLVILENFSTDDTLDILSQYSDSRITVRCANRPLSIVENWQRGLELLKEDHFGDCFVTFIGHDDYFYPDFLLSINALIRSTPTASLYQALFNLVDDTGCQIRPCRPIPHTESAVDFIQARSWGLRDSFGIGYVFRRSDYIKVEGIPAFPSLLFADDLLFARLSALGHKACLQTAQCAYRLHAGSASGMMTPAKINAHVEALASYMAAIQQEFTEMTTSPPARYALARLLARESMLYGSRITQWALTPSNRARANELDATFASMCEGTDWHDRGLARGPRLLARRLWLAFQLGRAIDLKGPDRCRVSRPAVARQPD
ncbi:glycosyltransferase family 2 protein [Polymorphobacter sp. PAMC 29334]|uniref:glycosyltransferase family 2 protein n=1 Tax=Polymorphobacter sp. PAMC 29334 TaxID=2862331 RepID=UPI001C66CB98|nr:glycosyltransferase family A protein [Polymorphobacter sp. PAMC 29334]QYE35955.1 glycosyltransferase family 2 protein [Polymorphobacter sp. PAMC 29334]